VKPEHIRQNIHRRLVTDRDIYPDDSVLTFEQPWELRNLMSLDTRIADKQDIHTFTTFHGTRHASTRGAADVVVTQAYHAVGRVNP
jgi:hypothetical protein